MDPTRVNVRGRAGEAGAQGDPPPHRSPAGGAGPLGEPAAGPNAGPSRPDPAAVAARLLAWFAAHRRPLPFRRDRSPYRVLVAEVMLQQTRATTVGPYLRRFLERFPDPASLAAADLQEVLALWSGLGYYTRARNLWRAAQIMVSAHGGGVPVDPTALRALPGVGPYIAGAVGSFAFGRDEAACDANAVRVLSRLFCRDAVDTAFAQTLVPAGRAADWNEALMDFGSLICVPRLPRCPACPLADLCAGWRAGRAAELPPRRSRPPRPEVDIVALLLRDEDGRFGLSRRPPRGLLAGMWECPCAEGTPSPREVAARHGVRLGSPPVPLPPFRHLFTHRAWRVRAFAATASGALRWVRPDELGSVALAGPSARLVAGALTTPCE